MVLQLLDGQGHSIAHETKRVATRLSIEIRHRFHSLTGGRANVAVYDDTSAESRFGFRRVSDTLSERAPLCLKLRSTQNLRRNLQLSINFLLYSHSTQEDSQKHGFEPWLIAWKSLCAS